MLTKNDLILLLTDIEKQGIDIQNQLNTAKEERQDAEARIAEAKRIEEEQSERIKQIKERVEKIKTEKTTLTQTLKQIEGILK